MNQRLDCAVTAASKSCPSLRGRKISPHSLRHTTAMHLLQSGVDLTVIALHAYALGSVRMYWRVNYCQI
ncbi:tyrosine-type recombinase/integrase [Shewanella sp. S1-49-MNA-CIBAN-0167]|uniref:tyrosine-type recombinase/integrase n=1 Tax=Shewanella sp. S1-49-MNA-CIBAN-0167 TaxID=3140468 RepID=UPI00331CCAA2